MSGRPIKRTLRDRRYSVERSRHLGGIYISDLWRIEGSRGRAVAS